LRPPGILNPSLELESKRQFHVARASASEKRVAGTNIRRGRYRKKSDTVSGGIESILREINAEIRPQRVGKVGMIEEVVNIESQLHCNAFSELGVLGQAEIKVLEVRADKSIAAKIAEMLVAIATVERCIDVAGDLKRGEIQYLAKSLGAGEWISDKVRPAKEFAAAVEVAFKKIVHIEWLPRGKTENTIQRPSVGEPVHIL
jgi:hypothetical protein